MRAFYYTAVIEDQEYSSIRPLIDWLDYNGYTVVTKATKEFVDQTGRRKVKGNMDIELAVDAMEIAPHIDQMVLFSGDGDFRSLVEAVQRRGVRVIVVSTISTQPPMVADELRRQCRSVRRYRRAAVQDRPRSVRTAGARAARRPRAPPHAAIPAAQPDVAARRSRGRRVRGRLAPGLLPMPRRRQRPGRDCPRCPRLVAFRKAGASASRTGSMRRCDSFGPRDARLLIVGLAPGLRGANRTGRPFTGDYAGDLLYSDAGKIRLCAGRNTRRGPMTGSKLVDCRITNAVRCVPPENKPTPEEITTCRQFLAATIADMPRLARRARARPHRPRHVRRGARRTPVGISVRPWRVHAIGGLKLFDSYHCSRYNTNTGVLTPEMFGDVIGKIRADLDAQIVRARLGHRATDPAAVSGVGHELHQRAVGIAEIDAGARSLGAEALHRPALDRRRHSAARCAMASAIGPIHSKHRSLLPGATGSRATSAGATPGPCTLSCLSPNR